MAITRRQFGSFAAGSFVAAASSHLWARDASLEDARYFRFAIIADTHIIDDFYHGHESNAFDTESLQHSAARLSAAREFINKLSPPMDHVFLAGDFVHNYPSTDYDFYFKNTTRFDNAKNLIADFKMPVHVAFGNHDYGVPEVSREMSHRLFEAKFAVKPYYAVEHKGWKFLVTNNFLGSTWDPRSYEYDRGRGSLGETQLQWLESELAERKPTVLIIHYPLWLVVENEISDFGLPALLRRYQENIKLVVAGHWHKWVDFSHTWGPQHYVMAATRYDPNAYMLVEVDTQQQSLNFLNRNFAEWSTHYAKPYLPK